MIQRIVLAACIARINLGYSEPSAEIISDAIIRSKNLVQATKAVFMEIDPISRNFMDHLNEAESFMEMMEGKGDAELLMMWSQRRSIIDNCMADSLTQ